MEIIRDLKEFHIGMDSAVAIGKFDGIHVGHKLLLSKLEKAKESGLCAVVFTFDPPPSVYFGKETKQLTTLTEKEQLFEKLGVDYLIEYPFNQESADMEPETYVRDILVGALQAKLVVAGDDISFGKKGLGNAKLLRTLAHSYDFAVEFVEKICINQEEISSSLVRACVEQGQMERVTEMLGEAFSVTGVVQDGNHIGRTIGFPTMNVKPAEGKLLPPNGVYYSQVTCDGTCYHAITNVGKKPTISDAYEVLLESFLYDYEGDAYGKTVTISLLHFVRSEQKFASFEQLKEAIDRDVEAGRNYFGDGSFVTGSVTPVSRSVPLYRSR